MLRGLGLLAAALVNFGSGRPPAEIIAAGLEYEAHLTGAATGQA